MKNLRGEKTKKKYLNKFYYFNFEFYYLLILNIIFYKKIKIKYPPLVIRRQSDYS